MKLNYSELVRFAEKFNGETLSALGRCQIQKLYSTPHFICISLRSPGKTSYLYIGRGGDFQGCFLGEASPESRYRIKDQFLEYLRRSLKNKTLKNIEIDAKDKILAFNLWKNGEESTLYLFWKGSTLYFATETEKEYFISWEGKKIIKEGLEQERFQIFDGIGRKDLMRKSAVRSELKLDEYYKNFFENYARKKVQNRKDKFFKNKIQKISKDLENVSSWKKIQDSITDPNFTFPAEKNPKIHNVKIKLEVDWEHYKKVSFTFVKIKSLKKAESILKGRLAETKKEYISWQAKKEPQLADIKVIYPCWEEKKRVQAPKQNSILATYAYGEAFKLAIGNNANENDSLRNKWGKKEDWWVHIECQKSAHCVVKITDGGVLTTELLALIGSVLRDKSKYEYDEIPLVFTQIKNLKGVKGQAGGVLIKNAKYLRVYYNQNWKNELINIIK